jgi:hypothetical protein
VSDLVSNVRVYLAIAEESASASQRFIEEGRRPKENGQPGYIVTHDPERRSFKQGLVAIAFAGMYLEALLSLVARERFGKDLYEKMDRHRYTYEEKLKLLGVLDEKILSDCRRFRLSRNDLMHEKAARFEELRAEDLRTAQEEAAHAIVAIKAIAAALNR